MIFFKDLKKILLNSTENISLATVGAGSGLKNIQVHFKLNNICPLKKRANMVLENLEVLYIIRRRHGLRVTNGLLIVFYAKPENGFHYILAWR